MTNNNTVQYYMPSTAPIPSARPVRVLPSLRPEVCERCGERLEKDDLYLAPYCYREFLERFSSL